MEDFVEIYLRKLRVILRTRVLFLRVVDDLVEHIGHFLPSRDSTRVNRTISQRSTRYKAPGMLFEVGSIHYG